LPSLSALQIQNNYFSGPIPESFRALQVLYILFAAENFLTGTIPASIGQLPRLEFLYIYENLLTGTLPSFAGAPQLYLLMLYENQLTGTLDDKFDPAQQPYLYYIDIDSNQFTGTLPDALFQAQSLEAFVANVNCFRGSISESICAAKKLTALVLDGLSSAKACRSLNFAGTYSINGAIQGGVPSCLFQMPNISSLHLSGNGLTGSLPPDLEVSPSMYDLTLSHNQLTGSIPRHIQQRKWYTLDMSYNRLTGTLIADFGAQDFNFSYFVEIGNLARQIEIKRLNTTERLFNVSAARERIIREVLLTDNRLSGKIPQSIRELKDVSVLGTNMFSCKLDGSDLPPADNGSGNYVCGSSAFDVPYYVWLVMTGILCAVAVGAIYKPQWTQGIIGAADAVEMVRKWLSFDPAVASGAGLRVFVHLLDRMCLAVMLLLGYILIVLLPLYCTMSAYYGEYMYEYAWSTSAAFMSGATPTGLEFTAWLVLLVLVLYGGIRGIQALHAQATDALSGKRASRVISLALERLPLNRSILIYIAYASVNLVVVIGVNVAYVYVAIYRSSSLQIFAQIMLSLFKMGWSSVCTSKTLRLSVQSVTNGRTTTASTFSDTDYASLQVFVVLLNNIIVPCCVVAAISPNCFYNAFVPAPEVRSEFFYQDCKVLGADNSCYRYFPTAVVIHYDPPFIYAYQCSSSLITYYAPAFVNLCVLNAFFSPAAQYVNLVLYRCAAPGSIWYRVLHYLLPRVLHPLHPASANSTHTRSVYNVHRLVNALMMYSGLLLTFGVVFPPLAVALAMTFICVAYYAKAIIGRFVCTVVEEKVPHYFELLEADCQSVGSVPLLLHNSLWMIVTIACWFYTLFLFDTLGDAVGFDGAYWVLIVVPLLPGVMYIVTALVEKYTAAGISEIEVVRRTPIEKENPEPATADEHGIELHAVARNPMTA
jgi:Leucine-rich repeat (LRR) protein